MITTFEQSRKDFLKDTEEIIRIAKETKPNVESCVEDNAKAKLEKLKEPLLSLSYECIKALVPDLNISKVTDELRYSVLDCPATLVEESSELKAVVVAVVKQCIEN